MTNTKQPSTISEHQIQSSILDWLKLKRICHFRLNTAAVVAEYKGKRRFFRSAPKGAPDIIATIQGRMICLEIKKPRMPLTEAQEEWHTVWSAAGALCLTIHSLEEAIKWLTPLLNTQPPR